MLVHVSICQGSTHFGVALFLTHSHTRSPIVPFDQLFLGRVPYQNRRPSISWYPYSNSSGRPIAMGHNPWLLGIHLPPIFDVQEGYRVLTHSHMNSSFFPGA